MYSNRSRCFPITLGRAAGGLLAVGLSIGAALATPGVASADSSTDPHSWIDHLLGGLSVPAQTTASDIQISISGINLFPVTADSPFAGSGPGDIAIAIGPGAFAYAGDPGTFDVAFADGADSNAISGAGIFDSAIADGANSTADAGGTGGGCIITFVIECTPETPGSFDLAADFGDMHASAIGNFLTDILPSL